MQTLRQHFDPEYIERNAESSKADGKGPRAELKEAAEKVRRTRLWMCRG